MSRRNHGVTKNVVIAGRRTSLCLEPLVWSLIEEICAREKLNTHQLCARIDESRGCNYSLSSAVRMHVLEYFVAAATEEGHLRRGHGSYPTLHARAA
ncbi:MAG TPA: ribbon-helix-helix domain-containing protein [Azospirillaceae bacterium]|nr:ribbon-helix-helix domain-containing protein [Azospirillaceae bacterium]